MYNEQKSNKAKSIHNKIHLPVVPHFEGLTKAQMSVLEIGVTYFPVAVALFSVAAMGLYTAIFGRHVNAMPKQPSILVFVLLS